jgi:hypothetical protein
MLKRFSSLFIQPEHDEAIALAATRLSTVLKTVPIQLHLALNAAKSLHDAVRLQKSTTRESNTNYSGSGSGSSSGSSNSATVVQSIVASWVQVRKVQNFITATTATTSATRAVSKTLLIINRKEDYVQSIETLQETEIILIRILLCYHESIGINIIFNHSLCIETIIIHVNRMLLFLKEEKEGRTEVVKDVAVVEEAFTIEKNERLLGILCIELLCIGLKNKIQSIQYKLIKRNVYEKLMIIVTHYNQDKDTSSPPPLPSSSCNNRAIYHSCIQLLLSLNVSMNKKSRRNNQTTTTTTTTVLIDSLTTMIMNNSNEININNHFAVKGILNIAKIRREEDENDWVKCIVRLSSLYSQNPIKYDFFTLLLCRVGHRIHSKRISYLLRAVVLNAWPPSWSISTATTTTTAHYREHAACALSILGDTMLPTSLIYEKKKGIKILSMDGGGTRGLATIISLKALEKKCGKFVCVVRTFVIK